MLLYLVSLLLIWVFPQLLPGFTQAPELMQFAQYGLPLLFLVMLALPAETDTGETPQVVDFFYSAMLFMIIALLVLGSFAFMTLGKVNYPIALTYSLLLIAAILLLLGTGLESARGLCRPVHVVLQIPVVGRPAVRKMAVFSGRAVAMGKAAGKVSAAGLRRSGQTALGQRRHLAQFRL